MGGWGRVRGNKKEGGGEREGEGGVSWQTRRESFPGSQSCWCWLYLDVKGKGLNKEDWQLAPAVTHKICLSLLVSEGGERRRRRDRD